jgi:hypothetical protein
MVVGGAPEEEPGVCVRRRVRDGFRRRAEQRLSINSHPRKPYVHKHMCTHSTKSSLTTGNPNNPEASVEPTTPNLVGTARDHPIHLVQPAVICQKTDFCRLRCTGSLDGVAVTIPPPFRPREPPGRPPRAALHTAPTGTNRIDLLWLILFCLTVSSRLVCTFLKTGSRPRPKQRVAVGRGIKPGTAGRVHGAMLSPLRGGGGRLILGVILTRPRDGFARDGGDISSP